MPTFLSDPSATTFVVLAVILAGTVFYWYRTQTRRGLYVMAAGVGLFALVLLCDELVESPREEAVQRIETLILAINESRPRTVAEQVSPQFRYGSITKDTLESARLWTLLREHNTSVAAWDFDRGYVEYPSPESVVIGFMSKASGSGHFGSFEVFLFVKAAFVQDPDGVYRIQTFTVYSDPLKKANGPVFNIPGIP